MDLKNVRFSVSNKIATITLDNPETRNGLTPEVSADFIRAIDYCMDDNEVRAVLINGANGYFCGGANLKSVKDRLDANGPYKLDNIRNLNILVSKILRIKKPVVASIEGSCAGGGLGLALASDFVIATEDTKFVVAFVNIALVPDTGTTYLISKAIGSIRAKDLMMSGRPFDAVEAAAMGLITKAVPPEKLKDETDKLLKKLVNGPTNTYGLIKSAVNSAMFQQFEAGLDIEMQNQTICANSYDHREGVTAFIEKRKAEFKGK